MAVTPNSIVTTQGVKSAAVAATAAKSTYNDVTNAVLLLTVGANGGMLTKLSALPRANLAAANQLQLFRDVGGAGTNIAFENAALMAAVNPTTATTAPTPTGFGYTPDAPMRLMAGDKLYVGIATALAGGIVFTAEYEEF